MQTYFGLIYRVTCTVNGKVYIGKTEQSLAQRWSCHVGDAHRGSNVYFHKAIRKHGPDAFTVEVLGESFGEVGALNLREIFAILSHRSTDPTIGYNSRFGGEGGSPTPQVRKKMSEVHRARWADADPKLRRKASARLRTKWEKRKESARLADLEERRKADKRICAFYTDPKERRKALEQLRAFYDRNVAKPTQWADQDTRRKMSDGLRASHQRRREAKAAKTAAGAA
jgi:group I intron endonuclease